MLNPNKYTFEGWTIEWDADCGTMFLSKGRHACSLGCAEGTGVAYDGDKELEVPDEVIAMAQELEEDCLSAPVS